MSKTYDALTDDLVAFIRAQKLFFVATAPLAHDGRVNLSPKGYDSLVIIDAKTLAWIDLGGSGVETIAHLRENKRITLMFCALEGSANIVRVYGEGDVLPMQTPEFEEMRAQHFPAFDRGRAVIRVRISSVSDSCGWGVPFYEFKGEREQLRRWVDARSLDEWAERRYETNGTSIDGLPALDRKA
ncbi:MAG: pyridoxamine 5'-phosphate oxidase family protein [Caulobacterales bacterium]